MKALPLIILTLLFASCGKEYIDKSVYTDKYIENPYTAPEAPEFALSFSDYNVDCSTYKGQQSFKRANSTLRMDVVPNLDGPTTLVNLGWSTIVTLKDNSILVNCKKVGEIEFPEQISLQIVAENGKVKLEVEELSIDLGIDVIPENVVYCHPDGKFVEMVQILDRLEF